MDYVNQIEKPNIKSEPIVQKGSKPSNFLGINKFDNYCKIDSDTIDNDQVPEDYNPVQGQENKISNELAE